MSAAHRPSPRSSRTRTRHSLSSPAVLPASPVASGNSANYAAQLHAAILSTREAIITEHQIADASRTAALGGLDVARRTFADSRYGLRNTNATRAVTAFLDQKIGDANETALNTVALGQNANSEAQNAAAAMSDAATSIKAAAAAVETVIVDVNGIAGVTNANDRDDPINRAAHEAVIAVAKLGKSVDELKCLALVANVQAASPKTAPVIQATQANQTSLSNLLATFDATLKTVTAAVGDAQTARTTDLNDLFAQSEAFTAAASDDYALGHAIKAMDSVSNDGLTVAVENAPSTLTGEPVPPDDRKQPRGSGGKTGGKSAASASSTADQAVPGFKVSWSLRADVAKETVMMTCFAVPIAEAPSFDYQSALFAQDGKHCASVPPAASEVKLAALPPTGSLILQVDSNGDPIQLGEQYRIFALRTPDAKHGPQTATHFSFPTPPITSTILLHFPGGPQLYPPAASQGGKDIEPLPHNAFVAVFPSAAPAGSIGSHRLFFAPAEVIEKEKDAELIIADALNAASFTEVTSANAVSHPPADLARKIWQQVYSEVPNSGKRPPPVPASLEAWLKHAMTGPGPFYVVYYSPFATTEAAKEHFVIGRYTDMYGDLFDIEERAYEAYALAVGADSDGRQIATNVLSVPSPRFPSNIHVAPLPTDTAGKAAKE